MNRGDFITLLEKPEGGNPTTIRDLDELIGIFPYFQGAQMLLLKVLKENTDIRFEKRLKQGAIYVADREQLYHYLMEKPTHTDVAPAVEAEAVSETAAGNVAPAVETDEPLLLSGDIESIEIDDIKGDNGDGLLILDEAPDAEVTPETASTFQNSGHNKTAVPEEESPSINSTDELIDRFIATNPRMLR